MPATDPRLVNIRELGYATRQWRVGTWPKDIRRIDRVSRYGNPFRIGDVAWTDQRSHPSPVYARISIEPGLTRKQVLRLYRMWLRRRLRREPDFLEPLRGYRLACWCPPLPCHGDVILEFLDRKKEVPDG